MSNKQQVMKTISEYLDQATRNEGWSRRESFIKFLEMSFIAQASGISKVYSVERHEELEERYKTIISSFRLPKETAAAMAEAFNALVNGLEILGYCDLLGEMWMDFGGNKDHQQFFTPYPICQMMTKMTCINMDTNEKTAIHDSAVGFGATLIATAEHARDAGVPQTSLHFETIDIDQICYWGGFTQMNLLGMHAHVYWGDSLAMDMYDMQPTLMAVMFPHTLKTKTKTGETETMPTPETIPQQGQMSFF